jgi:hypothetical protein
MQTKKNKRRFQDALISRNAIRMMKLIAPSLR